MVKSRDVEEDNNGLILENGNKSNCGYKIHIFGDITVNN